MGQIIRLSHIISQDSPSYGNRDWFSIKTNSAIQDGNNSNSSTWIFSNNHIGTHIDVPYHFCSNGKKTYELPLDNYFFNSVQLLDMPCNQAELIGIKEIEQSLPIRKEIELLLIRTGFENYRQEEYYWNNNPGLAPELAKYFRSNYPKLRCVGFDFISLTSWKYRHEGCKSHKSFLCPDKGNPILIIEDMSLKAIKNTIKWVIAAPIFVEDGNGGAITVFANQNQ